MMIMLRTLAVLLLFSSPYSLAATGLSKKLLIQPVFPLEYGAAQDPGDASAQRRRQAAQPKFLTPQTQKFAVNGSGLPDVPFDVGESYAGHLPIAADINDTSQGELFFWFFPSTNQAAADNREITLWLTGGPGCSSTGELTQSNGPFLWQPGVFAPFENRFSWHHLTNMVWVDQPVGSGFATGPVTAKSEEDVAKQFLGFWRHFIEAFSLQGYKVYVTGSSYSGMYCPYVTAAMLDDGNQTYFNVSGMMVFDGVFGKFTLQEDAVVASFVNESTSARGSIFGFNDSFSQAISSKAQSCGYTDYINKFLTYPAVGPQPALLPGMVNDDKYQDGCDLFDQVYSAARRLNPCFSVYSPTKRCPLAYDPLGFSESYMYTPPGAGPVYFDREDVKRAINVLPTHNQSWVFCSNTPVFVNDTDQSLNAGPASQPQLTRVIDATKNVIIGHGVQDMVLIADGTLLALQNTTWGGVRGFQSRPTDPVYVPYHAPQPGRSFDATIGGAGVVGTSRAERGLTLFLAHSAGHFLTDDQPSLAYRALEILLGRVTGGFQSREPFSTEANRTAQPDGALGVGTVPVVGGDGGSKGAGNGSTGAVQASATKEISIWWVTLVTLVAVAALVA